MTIVDFYKIPIGVSLGVIAVILVFSILASRFIRPKEVEPSPG